MITLKEEKFCFGIVYMQNICLGLSRTIAHVYNLEGALYFQGGIVKSVLEYKEFVECWKILIKEHTKGDMTIKEWCYEHRNKKSKYYY